MYIYPDNLKSKAMLWLWQLRIILVSSINHCLLTKRRSLNYTKRM